MKNDLYIVIVGCGRLGVCMANELSRRGHSVVVIDKQDQAFSNLSLDFSGFRIEGDATQMAVLNKAKLGKANILIATTHEDNINLMVAQIAKDIFKVPKAFARVFDPKKEAVYRQLGIKTICPTSVSADVFLKAITN